MIKKTRIDSYAETVLLFKQLVEKTDFFRFWDLRDLMKAFPHIKLIEGYSLDGCWVGDVRDAIMTLYAYKTDSEDVYSPGGDHTYTGEDVHFDPITRQYLRCSSPGSRIVAPPIPFKDGQVIFGTITSAAFNTVPPLYDYLRLKFSPEAVWEALLLLVEARSYLPHRWHGGYVNGEIILDIDTVIETCLGKIDNKEIGLLLSINDYYPNVSIKDDNTAFVNYYKWSEFHGLEKYEQVAKRNGKSISFVQRRRDTIFKYDNGLIF